jgi:hypothetical protein
MNDDLLRRAEHLRREHRTLQEVVDTLNAEGWHPATRLQTFDAEMVNRLLTPPKPDHGTHTPSPPPEKLVELK